MCRKEQMFCFVSHCIGLKRKHRENNNPTISTGQTDLMAFERVQDKRTERDKRARLAGELHQHVDALEPQRKVPVCK